MTKPLVAITLAVLSLVGCGYGPEHLPALYQQRDRFQSLIDPIVRRMAADKEWWTSLTPAERQHWKTFVEKTSLEEKERALTTLQLMSDALALASPESAAEKTADPSGGR